jgi:protein-L-isoaspartate(D-aspartate) O-methyltransferase
VTDENLVAAFSELPRERFVPAAQAGVAYVDKALPIAPGRYLQEPLFLARLLQEALPQPSERVLVIGAGTGYSTAILGRVAASVVGVESDEGLAEKARSALGQLGIVNAQIEIGPLEQGWPATQPYDVILIDGGIAELPDAIAQQLAERGRLVTIRAVAGSPVGAGMLYRRIGGRVSGRVLFDATGGFLPGFAPQPVFAL